MSALPKFNGIVIDDATSGNVVSVATRGIVVVAAGDTVTAGQVVSCVDGDCVKNLASTSGSNIPAMTTAAVQAKIGRAWSSATSGNYCLVELTP